MSIKTTVSPGCKGCLFVTYTEYYCICSRDGGHVVNKLEQPECYMDSYLPKAGRIIENKIIIKANPSYHRFQGLSEFELYHEVVASVETEHGRLYQLRNISTGRFTSCIYPESAFQEF